MSYNCKAARIVSYAMTEAEWWEITQNVSKATENYPILKHTSKMLSFKNSETIIFDSRRGILDLLAKEEIIQLTIERIR